MNLCTEFEENCWSRSWDTQFRFSIYHLGLSDFHLNLDYSPASGIYLRSFIWLTCDCSIYLFSFWRYDVQKIPHTHIRIY